MQTSSLLKKQLSYQILYMFVGLVLGVIVTLVIYFVFYSSDNNSNNDDTGTGNIPTVGDYWFGESGSSISGNVLSGSLLTGTQTGDSYPSDYIEQFQKALSLLKDSNAVNTYLDTDNIVMTGFDKIQVHSIAGTVAPTLTISGSISSDISKVYIIGSNKDGIYLVEPVSIAGQTWSFALDNKKNTIKPGLNTYYILGRINNDYVLQYINIKTLEGAQFYSNMDKICLFDLCTDPNLPKTIQTDGTILQQSSDGAILIKLVPEVNISIAKRCSGGGISLQQIKKLGDNYQKVTKECDYEKNNKFSQTIVDKLGNPVSDNQTNLNLPGSLRFGNVRYIGPILNISNNTSPLIKAQQLTSNTVPTMIKSEMYVGPELTFELPDSIFATYRLDTTQLRVVGPSKTVDGRSSAGYLVTPKVASWMSKAIVYTVSSTDIDTHDKISAYFTNLNIINTPNCSNPHTNKTDPEAKFGVFPIDTEYDIIGLRGCYTVQAR